MYIRVVFVSMVLFCAILSLLTGCTPASEPEVTEPVADLPATSSVPPLVEASDTPEAPEATKVPEAAATLFAATPSLEITFDGETCEAHQAGEISPGEHVLVLHNQSELNLATWIGRLYPGKSFQDLMTWYEEVCGPPGSTCRGKEREAELNWIEWFKGKQTVKDGLGNIFYLADFNKEGDYFLWVDIVLGGEGAWPCAPFEVIAAP